MRSLRPKLLALVTAIVVALPAYAFAQAAYLCSMTGEVSPSCCCTAQHAEEACGPELKAQDCCQLIKADKHATPSSAPSAAHYLAAPALAQALALAPVVRDFGALQAHRAERARLSTHPPGPPRFLANCSFLI